MVYSTFMRSFECFDDIRLQGVLVTVGRDGKSQWIERIDVKDTASASES